MSSDSNNGSQGAESLDRWERLVSVPDYDFGGTRRCNLETLLRISTALGYEPSQVRVGVGLDPLEEYVIELWVVKGSRPTLREVDVRLPFRHAGTYDVQRVEVPAAPKDTPAPLPAAAEAFSCDECGASFASQAGRNGHLAVHRKGAEVDIACPHCDQKFSTTQGLAGHIGFKHKDVPDPPEEPEEPEEATPDEEPIDATPAEEPIPDDLPRPFWREGEPMFGCDTCAWYTNSEATMTLHTTHSHGRDPVEKELQEMSPARRELRLARSA